MKCKYCKKSKDDVSLRVNPYYAEIHNEEIEEYMCDDCYNDVAMDI